MIPGGSSGAFRHDDKKWKLRVKHYKTLLPVLASDEIQNVMGMNTVSAGFAAAPIDDPLWVMNVVSSYSAISLDVVFDRGLIGTYHDWCEAFSTYPRTYDLLHLDGLFTAESHRCDMEYVLLEMDLILRLNGGREYGVVMPQGLEIALHCVLEGLTKSLKIWSTCAFGHTAASIHSCYPRRFLACVSSCIQYQHNFLVSVRGLKSLTLEKPSLGIKVCKS
ncbi:hypothetical protein MRB53_019365 [Persea americana]|uniref:Uncharacterized protein n=1 Tax=Persea americana TaxID=3435 RepID=A0ACC2KY63_PERAE|nr:hypothetical protein MRB53_019365 [Persea americana]